MNVKQLLGQFLRDKTDFGPNAPQGSFGEPLLNLVARRMFPSPKEAISICKVLLDAGADVNGQCRASWSPLHEAAWLGEVELASLLISYGANVNQKTKIGPWNDYLECTPLDFALRENRNDMAKLLRRHSGKTKEELEGETNE